MTTATKNNNAALEAVLKNAKSKVVDVKATKNDYRPIPGFTKYEVNSAGVVRRILTGAIQQLPTGKTKYLLFNDKNERRQFDPKEIKKIVPTKTANIKEGGPSKKEIIIALDKEGLSIKDIIAKTKYTYNTIYVTLKVHKILSLHAKGKTPTEIAKITGFSKESVIWQISN